MILIDIGNSFFHIYEEGRIWKETLNTLSSFQNNKPIFFISVNQQGSDRLLKLAPHAINLREHLYLDSIYKGLGVDRLVACKAISDGVIIDAGTAITVDVMQNNTHLGGYILPGLGVYSQCLKSISPILNQGLNVGVDLNTFPQNTRDAISYGVFKSILLMLKETCKSKHIYFTGGDGKYLSRFFEHSIYDNSLIFRGMLKVISESYFKKKKGVHANSSAS
jgi:type III pantothenate kinase